MDWVQEMDVSASPVRMHLLTFVADNIGGDMYAAGGLSLFTPVPGVVNWPLKGHFFVNAGSSVPYNTSGLNLKRYID